MGHLEGNYSKTLDLMGIFRYKLQPYERANLRLWYSGITSAFQAEEAGSIPVGRSLQSP